MPARKARDLSIVAERRIDEGGRAEQRSCHSPVIALHPPRYSAARCCCRNASSACSSPPRSTCQKAPPVARRRAPATPHRPCGSTPLARSQRPVGAERGAVQRRLASARIVPRRHHSAFNQNRRRRRAAAHACREWLSSRFHRAADLPRSFTERPSHRRVALDPDPVAAQPLGDRARCAGAEERIEHEVARLGGGEHDPVEQRLGLLGRMRFRRPSPLIRSAPVQIGSIQSDRICSSSLSAFIAS